MAPSVCAVVVNWNRWSKTLQCVDSLAMVDYPALRVVVVDNGSDDAPPRELQLTNLDVIESSVNLGFAGGCNLGIRRGLDCGADYVLVLNNDARLGADSVTELVACGERNAGYGAFAPRVVDPRGFDEPGTFELYSPDRFRLQRLMGVRREDPPCRGCADEGHAHDAFLLRGPSLLLRAKALRVTGLFDESYFHYFEEIDLVERIRRAGWRIGFCCRSTVTHDKGGTLDATTPQALYYLYRNEMLFRRKLYGWSPLRTIARQPIRWLLTAFAPHLVLSGEFRPTAALAMAIGDAMRGRSGRRDLGARFRSAVGTTGGHPPD